MAVFGRPRPVGNTFELYAWIFMRLSGLALLFLALGHLFIMHLLGDETGFGVDRVTYEFVLGRWTGDLGLFWRLWDGSLLYLAMLHGLNGLRTVIDDYVHTPTLHGFFTFLLLAFAMAFLGIGTITILLFSPPT
ncbi:MAG: succinate dehydrogenase [Chloroflexi bacterium]|nr:succinate dehydrogenase [Chloroflexota bacterium]